MEQYNPKDERSQRRNKRLRSSYGFSQDLVSVDEQLIPLRRVPDAPAWRIREAHTRKMLSRVLDLGTTVAFVGAGCSAALGYPTWAKLTKDLVKRIEKSKLCKLPEFVKTVADKKRPHTEELLHVLGLCKEILYNEDAKKKENGNTFIELVGQIFKSRKQPQGQGQFNPYNELVQLNLRRFVTTNYDCELEDALAPIGGIGKEEARWNYGFTQDRPERLAKAPLSSLSSQEPIVFHCHGWLRDPDSLVLTENDYRRWYLAEDQPKVAEFRQTLEILFGSNPVLFVGFGMEDDDLMRVLRTIVANEPGIPRRPLFAVLPINGKEVNNTELFKFDLLCARYGIHVLTYQKQNTSDWGLTAELDRIGKALRDHRNRWLCKPKVRDDRLDKGGVAYFHYRPEFLPDEELKFPSITTVVEQWFGKLHSGARPRVLGVVGQGGSGKSTFALKLIDKLRNGRPSFEKFFFWSSYYANDIVTGIDSALRFLTTDATGQSDLEIGQPPDAQGRSRMIRLIKEIEKTPCLLVFDGIERLLRPGKIAGQGAANSAAARAFLKKLPDAQGESTVVFTSRLWPDELSEKDGVVEKFEIRPCSVDDVRANLQNSGIRRKEDFASPVSLLDGHLHGVVLTLKSVLREKRLSEEDRAKHFDNLLYELSRRRPDECVFRMLGWILQDLKKKPHGSTAYKLLNALSVFMEPVPLEVAKKCLMATKNEEHRAGKLTADLRERGLLVPVSTELVIGDHSASKDGSSKEPPAFAVHPTVREYMFRRVHHGRSVWPNLSLAGATAATATVDPGNAEAVRMVRGLFDTLCKAAEKAPRKSGVLFARYAFSILRSRMTATTVPRWATYSEYLALLVRITDLARNYSHGQWRHAYREGKNSLEGFYRDKDAILRVEELAWLYNEIGLAHYLRGSIVDALGIWQQAFEINRLVDSEESLGEYMFQAHCNLGAANIQYGRLGVAAEYLRTAKEIHARLGDDCDHGGRIDGYLALIEHLRGNFNQAETGYVDAVKKLSDAGNLRGQSIFLRHLADLHMKKEKLKEAKESIQTSRALAHECNHPELVQQVRLSEGHLSRLEENYAEATRAYLEVAEFSRKKELRSLEADALSELSRLALNLGDYHTARYRAIKALHIANELVLGLRQTHGLVVLGLASARTGQPELGCAYLEQAVELADKQGYLTRKQEAQNELYTLGLVDVKRKSA